VVPASSRATREATSFSSGETLAAAAPWADRDERDGEVTATDGQAQDRKRKRGQRQGPATALREPSATGVSSPVAGRLAKPLRGRAR
jgi:hypothetical protein